MTRGTQERPSFWYSVPGSSNGDYVARLQYIDGKYRIWHYMDDGTYTEEL
jgi:hypothetical protein